MAVLTKSSKKLVAFRIRYNDAALAWEAYCSRSGAGLREEILISERDLNKFLKLAEDRAMGSLTFSTKLSTDELRAQVREELHLLQYDAISN